MPLLLQLNSDPALTLYHLVQSLDFPVFVDFYFPELQFPPDLVALKLLDDKCLLFALFDEQLHLPKTVFILLVGLRIAGQSLLILHLFLK